MNTWYWEHVKPGLMVETAKVNTHTQFARAFMYKQYRCTVVRYARLYPALFQHFIDMLLHNIEFVCAELVLLMAWGWCVFVNKANGMVKCTMWSLPKLLKHVSKLIT